MAESKIKIVVHSGNYHADDCTAYAILSYIFPNNELVRSREIDDPSKYDFIVDVGGKFDNEKYFDHHQRDFSEYRSYGEKIKYASAGLVWRKFGANYIKKFETKLTDEQVDYVKDYIDKNFIMYIDANDNGINIYDDNIPTISKIVYLYNITFGYINLDGFLKSSEIIKNIIDGLVLLCVNYFESEKIVLSALEKANLEGSQYIILEKNISFAEVVENHWDKFSNILLALYPSSQGVAWRIQSLQEVPRNRFSNRCKAPEQWRGLREDDLDKITGIEETNFIHPAGFTGGGKNKESTLKLANLWLKLFFETQNKNI